jgi:hypothetical protein
VLNSDYVEGSTRPDEALAIGAAGTSAADAALGLAHHPVQRRAGRSGASVQTRILQRPALPAAAIAPGSFNDIRYGNNINSFVFSQDKSYYANTNGNLNDFNTPLGVHQPNSGGYSMIPTGEGYSAGESYDMASGLGTPNGLLLARTLSAIAHSQVYYSDTPGTPGKIYVPDLLDSDGASAASQTVLLQYMSDHAGNVERPDGLDQPRLFERRLRCIRLDEPLCRADAAAGFRSRPGDPVRQAAAGQRCAVVPVGG